MKKIRYAPMKVTSMMIEATKEKVPMSVQQVEKHSAGAYRITFKKLEHPGFIIEEDSKVRFIHYCEIAAQGNKCSHMALGVTVADMLGQKVELIGLPTEPVLYADLDEEGYQDVSMSVGVIPPVTTPAATSSPSAPTPKPIAKATPTAVKTKRDWTEGWNEVQDYLVEQGITPSVVVKVREKRMEMCDSVALTPMAVAPAKPNFPYMGDMLGRAIRHILTGRDLILAGDKGSGKDTLVSTLAWVFSLPVYLQTGNADETKESVVGENTIVQGPKGTEIEFRKTAFATAVENGGLSHYAELNMMSPDTTALFHSVLDENRQLPTQAGPINRNENHIFIGSINLGDQYQGVKKLNGALKDRCAILHMPYVADFKEMLIRKTGLTDSHMLNFFEATKKAIDDLILTEQQGDESKTIRGFIAAAEHIKEYGPAFETKVEVLEDFIINKTEDFEERMAIRHQIRLKAWSDFPKSREEEEYENGGM